MDSLVGYGSDDEIESERYGGHSSSVGGGYHGAPRRREDDTNYEEVNMDMSEDSQGAESEPELPPAEPAPPSRHYQHDRRGSDDSRSRDRSRDRNRSRESDRDRKDRRRESPARSRSDRDRVDRPDRPDRPERRSPRRDDRYARSDRNDRGRGYEGNSRRGLLGDRPDDRAADGGGKVPALMDLKPFGGEPPPGISRSTSQARDARDAVSPRFTDRDRRDRDRGDRERDRDRHGRRSDDRRSRGSDRHSRSRSRERGGAAFPPPPSLASSSSDRRGSPPSGDYRPSSYKVNKKLEVMEKMGLQIKTPDGSMATARELRAAAGDAPHPLSAHCYSQGASSAAKILDQVNKRKQLWAHKREAEAEAGAQWTAATFAQDSDGRQASKFMRLMGIRDPAAVKADKPASGDGMKKQEELFQAMQAQYDVARATTHTMRGVGLGFSRNQY